MTNVFSSKVETDKNVLLELAEVRALLTKHYVLKSQVRELVRAILEEEMLRFEQIKDDAVRALNFLCERGIIDRKELNEAIKGD